MDCDLLKPSFFIATPGAVQQNPDMHPLRIVLMGIALCSTGTVFAQNPFGEPIDVTCDPACAAGTECRAGSCVQVTVTPTICQPACGTGFVCSSGICVAQATSSGLCQPECASGMVCQSGVCMTAPALIAPQPTVLAEPQTELDYNAMFRRRAIVRGVVGLIGAVGSAVFGVGAGLAEMSQVDEASYEDGRPDELGEEGVWLAGSLVMTAAFAPIAESGGRNGRSGGGVGLDLFRSLGWTAFAGSLALGVVTLVLEALDQSAEPLYFFGAGLLGAVSSVLFSIDSILTARDPAAIPRAGWAPSLGVMRDAAGSLQPSLGVSGLF